MKEFSSSGSKSKRSRSEKVSEESSSKVKVKVGGINTGSLSSFSIESNAEEKTANWMTR